jgi:hypothetical protein
MFFIQFGCQFLVAHILDIANFQLQPAPSPAMPRLLPPRGL